ncbi:hypothetical protein [Stutzerimonas balearica]|uniref:hypothetical protein n=1 Tax=Stutzerimonas balearica TaxID=74829 RepID=UPI0028AB9C08|nr:hypothetical protein [Stutzerimonas balearica]
MPKPLYLISTTAASIAAAFALQLPSAEKHAANTSPAATYARSISPQPNQHPTAKLFNLSGDHIIAPTRAQRWVF